MDALDALIKGFVVGVAVAAPVGPIGLLCIRRTLADGRIAGLATGFGAATADAVYGVLAATGLALSGLLLSHATLMTAGGALILGAIGLATLRKAFTSGNGRAVSDVRYYGTLKAFGSTFALTIANPMTILSFVALIAGLGAGSTTGALGPLLLVIGVFLGSAAWWLGLVHLTVVVRGRVTPRLMRSIDAVSGLVLLGWSGWLAAGLLQQGLSS